MKLVRNLGLYLGHLLTAVIGTAILSTGFWKLFHTTTIIGVIWKEWVLDIALAGVLGLLAYRISRSRLAAWIWIPPAIWFGLRVLMIIPTVRNMGMNGPSLWYEISGQDCVNGVRSLGCANFLLFTVTFIRSVAYSIGSAIGALVLTPSPSVKAAAEQPEAGSASLNADR